MTAPTLFFLQPRLLRFLVAATCTLAFAAGARGEPAAVEVTLAKTTPFSIAVRARILRLPNAVQITILDGEIAAPGAGRRGGGLRLLGMQASLHGPATDGGRERVALAFSRQVAFDRPLLPGFKFTLPAESLLIPLDAERARRIEQSHVVLGFSFRAGRGAGGGGQETFLATPDTIFNTAAAPAAAGNPAAR